MMREAGGGAIVNIGSLRLTRLKAGAAAYIASKGALLYLTRCWPSTTPATGSAVNMVSPGLVLTPFTQYVIEGYADPEEGKRRRPGYPLAGSGPRKMSPRPASTSPATPPVWITGQVLNVDGGMSAT